MNMVWSLEIPLWGLLLMFVAPIAYEFVNPPEDVSNVSLDHFLITVMCWGSLLGFIVKFILTM